MYPGLSHDEIIEECLKELKHHFEVGPEVALISAEKGVQCVPFDESLQKKFPYFEGTYEVFDALMKSKIIGVCPNCGKPVVEREKGWFCENRECRFVLWKDNAFFKRLGKRLDAHVADKLLRDGRVRLKDCKSAKGKTYNATVLLSCEADGRSKFSLEFEGGC